MESIPARVSDAARTLKEAGIPDAEADLDARLLAQFVLGWDTAQLLSRAPDPFPDDRLDAYEGAVRRRALREPLAYITGFKEFWNLEFEVTPAVLIPRPETELIVEAVLARIAPEARVTIADVGTGSGCLAVTLAHERSLAAVTATDVSAAALSVARSNAARHRVDDRVRFSETDLLSGVAGPFDVVVSNPPYVPAFERPALQPEVRDYEPARALFADAGGLAVIRRLVDQSIERLERGGILIFEFGFGQAEAIRILLGSTNAFIDIQLIEDLQAIPRTAVAERR